MTMAKASSIDGTFYPCKIPLPWIDEKSSIQGVAFKYKGKKML
jgi:hypothetical protein